MSSVAESRCGCHGTEAWAVGLRKVWEANHTHGLAFDYERHWAPQPTDVICNQPSRPGQGRPVGVLSPAVFNSHVEDLGINLVLLSPKPGFCHFFQMIVFHDKHTMFLHCSALLPLVPDRQNDYPGQPLNPDALYGSVAKTASALKTVFTES